MADRQDSAAALGLASGLTKLAEPRRYVYGPRVEVRAELDGAEAAAVLAEIDRLRGQRDKLLERLEADPDRAAIAAVDGLRKVLAEDDQQAHRILDWIGVAGDLPLVERVRILALELATKQGYTLDEAERLAPPAFKEANPNV